MAQSILLITGLSILGEIFLWLIIEKGLRRLIKSFKKRIEVPILVIINGFLELLMYSLSLFINLPEFILLWIGVKTALRWDRKNDKTKIDNDFEQEKGTYLLFLIGNGLVIIFSYVIASIAKNDILKF